MSASIPRRGPAGAGVLYHNMLVSPRVGGAEQLAIEIHKHIEAGRPGSSEILVPAAGDTEKVALSDGLRHRTYRFDWLMKKARVPALLANLGLFTKLGGSSRNLLHVHSPFVFGALRPMLTLGRTRTVLHLHLDYSEEELGWGLGYPPDVAIICASFMRDRVARVLASRGWHNTRIVPVINAVDTERYVPGDRAEAKRQLGVSADTPVFLMAANLAPHKGQETAIRAVARLLGQGHRPQLWLVGEEREKAGFTEQLHRCVADLGAGEQVRFLGFRNDIPKLMHAADCLLLPSTREGLPLSILEAQASKVVVLAAPTAGIPEVIEHGRTGFLIDAHDAEGYASALAMLLTNPAQAESVREAAYRQVIDSFTLKRYCARILEQYDEVLA